MPNADIYSQVTQRIMEALEAGTVPWRKPWASKAGLSRNAITERPYRGINAALLSMAPYADPRWLTFNQAKSLDGCVRKGEKGTHVIFWKMLESKTEVKKDGTPALIPMLRDYVVFNVAQCDGLTLAPLDETENPFSPSARAEDLIHNMPKAPTIEHGGGRACYIPSMDKVTLPAPVDFESPDHFYSTAFHELTHSTGHACRLNRHAKEGYTIHFFGDDNYSREELVAEFGAAFLSAEAGIESTIPASAAYINHWMSQLRKDPKLLVTAAGMAQKAADFILNRSFDKKDEVSNA